MIMENNMENKELLIKKIEDQNTDFESGLVDENIIEFIRDGLHMRKNYVVNSPYANKILSIGENPSSKTLEKAEIFYEDINYSWWIRRQDNYMEFKDYLLNNNHQIIDEYHGMLLRVEKFEEVNHQIVEIETDDDIWKLVNLSTKIWGSNSESLKQSIFNERKNYINLPDRRGGYIGVISDGEMIGYGAYRISSDGETMYLNGTGVDEEYRKQGLYTSILNYRINIAFKKKVKYVVTQAREGYSAPILERFGFEKLSYYYVLGKK